MTVLIIIAAVILALMAGGYLASRMPGQSAGGEAAAAGPAQHQLADKLFRHVDRLAGEIGERHIWRPQALESAADYIAAELTAAGYEVTEQTYSVHNIPCRNLVAEITGSTRPDDIIVVGAHYDTVPGTPGANDNGSGIALLLETARLMAGTNPQRTIRFVAFVNEEPPFFKTGNMGSYRYAAKLKQENSRVVGMFSLETVGHFDSRPGSQAFPLPLLKLFYPDRGDFIAFVGNIDSRRFLRRTIGSFRRHATLPSEGISAPGWVTGVDWSDHWSFWQHRYPAVMVTDTAPFRYAHYHAGSDTPDQVDTLAMARLAEGFVATLQELAGATGETEND